MQPLGMHIRLAALDFVGERFTGLLQFAKTLGSETKRVPEGGRFGAQKRIPALADETHECVVHFQKSSVERGICDGIVG